MRRQRIAIYICVDTRLHWDTLPDVSYQQSVNPRCKILSIAAWRAGGPSFTVICEALCFEWASFDCLRLMVVTCCPAFPDMNWTYFALTGVTLNIFQFPTLPRNKDTSYLCASMCTNKSSMASWQVRIHRRRSNTQVETSGRAIRLQNIGLHSMVSPQEFLGSRAPRRCQQDKPITYLVTIQDIRWLFQI